MQQLGGRGTKALTNRIFKLLEKRNQIIWEFISLIHPRFVIIHSRLQKKIKN